MNMNSLLKQLHHVEDEVQGPSIDSENMEERIECRRLRIKARIENQKRLERGELDTDKDKHFELSKSRKQIELSRTRVNKLSDDGMEFLTNVRVASDARENARRTEDEELARVRREKLESEAKTGLDRFEEITKKWESALQKEVPQDLNEMLLQQTDACNIMIDEKNKLITDLQLECKAKDDSYVKELKKQSDDIDLMILRMNEQIDCMRKAYKEELGEIEKAFLAQRDDLIVLQNKEWTELLDAIRNKQVDYLEARAKRAEENDLQISTLRASHAEEYNALKIKLENEVQVLEQNIQTAKATFQLNLEKLEYNFQVLKKRDEENTITKSQQKRKITRMQDNLNNLKLKLVKVEKQCRAENEQLTEDYKRRMELFRELQRKSRTLLKADAKHFKDIWLMNESDIQDYSKKILDADRIISEQQLGLSWVVPNTEFLHNKGPLISEAEKIKTKSATEVIREVLKKEETMQNVNDDNVGETDNNEKVKSQTIQGLNPSTVRSLLNLICDEGSFLIEEKLKKLLEPIDENESSLMKLDAIFTALGIEDEEDINRMLPYFLVQFSNEDSNVLNDQIDEDIDNLVKYETEVKNVIHPIKVVQALHDFVTDFYQDAAEMEKAIAAQQADDFHLDAVDTRDDSRDTEYWLKYEHDLIDSDKEVVWDALTEALEKYLNILTFRKKLLVDVDAFKTQNNELKFLLQQYMNSSVNRDLQVPPSKVIQYN